jgi:hypothetical protein
MRPIPNPLEPSPRDQHKAALRFDQPGTFLVLRRKVTKGRDYELVLDNAGSAIGEQRANFI